MPLNSLRLCDGRLVEDDRLCLRFANVLLEGLLLALDRLLKQLVLYFLASLIVDLFLLHVYRWSRVHFVHESRRILAEERLRLRQLYVLPE